MLSAGIEYVLLRPLVWSKGLHVMSANVLSAWIIISYIPPVVAKMMAMMSRPAKTILVTPGLLETPSKVTTSPMLSMAKTVLVIARAVDAARRLLYCIAEV